MFNSFKKGWFVAMKKAITLSLVLIMALAMLVCAPAQRAVAEYPSENPSLANWLPPEAPMGFIRADGRTLRDEAGVEFCIRAIRFQNPMDVADGSATIWAVENDEATYADMQSMGFNAVRLYLSPAYFGAYGGADAAWAWLDRQIELASIYQVRLILTMAVDLRGEACRAFWQARERQDELIALWTEIARRYRDETAILGFDLLNEPTTFQDGDFGTLNGEDAYMQWLYFAEEMAFAIRTEDGNHLLFMQSFRSVYLSGIAANVPIGNGQGNMMRLNDENTVYGFVFAEGESYASQGAAPQSDAPLYYPYPGYMRFSWAPYSWADTTNYSAMVGADALEWTLLEAEPFTVQNPDLALGVLVLKGDRLGENGVAYFDNLTLTEYDEQGNVVGEPYRMFFDGPPSTDATFWSEDGSGYPYGLSAGGMEDSGCMAIGQTMAAATLSMANFPLTQGHTYSLSAWVKGENLSDGCLIMPTIDLYTPNEGETVWMDGALLEEYLGQYIAFGENNNVPILLDTLYAGLGTFENDRGGDRWLNDLTELCGKYAAGYCYDANYCSRLSPWGNASADQSIPDAVLDALVRCNGESIRKTEQTWNLEPLGVCVTIPAGWICSHPGEDDWWAFNSVWQNAELAFWILEGTKDEEFPSILAESEQGSEFYRDAHEKTLAGREAVRYTDEAGQFCAQIALEDGRLLYASYSDRGDNAELLEAVLETLSLTGDGAQSMGQGRAAEIAAFAGTAQELEMEAEYIDEIRGWSDGAFCDLTVRKQLVNATPYYEVFLDNGEPKPVVLFFHGGGEGGNKTEFMETACMYAMNGFYSVCVDVAGYGESGISPIDSMFGIAETVGQLDGIIEYLNTLPNADADRFCLYGHSMGGFVAFSYVAHGKYKPAAIACSCSTPNFMEMAEWLVYACTDHGEHIANIQPNDELYQFAEAYSPIHWPERFLDVTVYAGNGLADDIVYPTGCQQLEAALTELGGERFTFVYMEDRGHGDQYVLEDFQPFDTLCAAAFASAEEGPVAQVVARPEGGQAEAMAETFSSTYEDAELARAVALGIGEYRASDSGITYPEFFMILDKAVEVIDETKLADWRAKFPEAREATHPIDRCNAMLAFFYAAEVLRGDYYDTFELSYIDVGQIHWEATAPWEVDEWRPDYFWGDTLLHPINYGGEYGENSGNYGSCAYVYSMAIMSEVSGLSLFDYDAQKQSMRCADPLTYWEALRAALRFCEVTVNSSLRTPTALDEEILAAADARRQAIVGTPTEVAVRGRSYYVSTSGNDKNDGRSPEKAWRTLKKASEAKLKPGDGVFFKRGDIWRGEYLVVKEGVTYSAYGEGAKPAFYGSPENGAGEEKWTLVDGSDNIWVYYKDLPECGTIVLNDSVATLRIIPCMIDGKYVMTDGSGIPFDYRIALTENLSFYSDDLHFLAHDVYSAPKADCKLYFRCDEGNPGKIYESIEFCAWINGELDIFDKGLIETHIASPCDEIIIDNIEIKYCGIYGINANGATMTVQNCMIGWIGGCVSFYPDGWAWPIRQGNCVGCYHDIHGYSVRNCYLYQAFDAGISNEGDVNDSGYKNHENVVYEGNLIEYCTYGISMFIVCQEPSDDVYMKNVRVNDNIVLNSGFGWGNQRIDQNVDAAFHIERYPYEILDFHVTNNVFYRAHTTLLYCWAGNEHRPAFSGNTYVQDNFGFLAFYRSEGMGGNQFPKYIYDDSAADSVRDVLGDTSAVVAPLSYPASAE